MSRFIVYPKKGESFTLELDGFEVGEDEIKLSGHPRLPRGESYLSRENVAAIAPASIRDEQGATLDVYLRGRAAPLRVEATHFEMAGGAVSFRWESFDYDRRKKVVPNPDAYAAASEVIAIVPSAWVASEKMDSSARPSSAGS